MAEVVVSLLRLGSTQVVVLAPSRLREVKQAEEVVVLVLLQVVVVLVATLVGVLDMLANLDQPMLVEQVELGLKTVELMVQWVTVDLVVLVALLAPLVIYQLDTTRLHQAERVALAVVLED